jgi:predicted DNA-binding transcriptional regulator AlpA
LENLAMSDVDFPSEDRIISEAQAAEVLGVHISTLRRAVAAGRGPIVIRMSPRRIGYRIRDLRNWLSACAEGAVRQ